MDIPLSQLVRLTFTILIVWTIFCGRGNAVIYESIPILWASLYIHFVTVMNNVGINMLPLFIPVSQE